VSVGELIVEFEEVNLLPLSCFLVFNVSLANLINVNLAKVVKK
jgi:hypothetical protein